MSIGIRGDTTSDGNIERFTIDLSKNDALLLLLFDLNCLLSIARLTLKLIIFLAIVPLMLCFYNLPSPYSSSYNSSSGLMSK